MIYPQDTQTYLIDNYGSLKVVTGIPPNSSVLNIHIQTDGGLASVWCGDPDGGGYPIGETLGTNFNADMVNFCSDNVFILQNGDTNTDFYSISYVNRDITAATSSQPLFYNGFSYGEIVSGVFLFLIVMVLGFSLLLKMLYPKR